MRRRSVQKIAALTYLVGTLGTSIYPRACTAQNISLTNHIIKDLEQRLAKDPADYISETALARSYLQRIRDTGDLSPYHDAISRLDNVLKEFPEFENALLGKISGVMLAHDFPTALTLIDRSKKAGLKGSALESLTFDAKFEHGDISEASAILDELLKASPDTPPLLLRKAKLAEILGKSAEAEELLRRSVSLQSDTSSPKSEVAPYRLALGKHLFNHGRTADAEKEYSAAREEAPEWWAISDHIAELHAAERKFDEAATTFEREYANNHRPDVAQSVGDVLSLSGKTSLANQWYDRALAGYSASLDRGETFFIHHLSQFFSDVRPDPDRAVVLAQRDLELRRSPDAYDQLAWSLYKKGALAEARRYSDEAMKFGGFLSHIVYHAAMIRGAAGDFKGSKELLTKASELNPNYLGFHVHR